MKLLEIDGSHGEGGGQLTRLAIALAAIAGRPIRLAGIRARRAKPGLMAQHLAAVRAVTTLSAGSIAGDRIGSTELDFRPGPLRGGTWRFEVGTAGSIALVLQAVLPVALRANVPSEFIITGGTDVPMAPPFDYLRLVFLPWLALMGAEIDIELVRRGYYPRGGGEVRLRLRPCPELRPLQLGVAGPLQAIGGEAHVAHLPAHIPERMAAAARKMLAGREPVDIATRVLGDAEAVGQGGAIVLAARTANGGVGSAEVAERGVPAEQLGRQAGEALSMDIESGATADAHAADQLLIYTALAVGSSQFTVRKVSQHALTAMWLIAQFLPVRFRVEASQGLHRIEVIHG